GHGNRVGGGGVGEGGVLGGGAVGDRDGAGGGVDGGFVEDFVHARAVGGEGGGDQVEVGIGDAVVGEPELDHVLHQLDQHPGLGGGGGGGGGGAGEGGIH